ncbi:MAG: domain containing protein [Solirubrobacterales bacterium]|nr:domain containing protein [Solirubrobacterales bacterium]
MSRTSLALGAACGFLAGVLVVIAFGGAGTTTETVVRNRTVTVTSPTITNGGTVIVQTSVPALAGERLDVAKDRLDRAGFDPDVEGGGLFGILKDSNWEVVSQDPGPGIMLEQGSSVHIRVEKR